MMRRPGWKIHSQIGMLSNRIVNHHFLGKIETAGFAPRAAAAAET